MMLMRFILTSFFCMLAIDRCIIYWQMQVHHEFRKGSLCLVKVEQYPHWPAKVLSCHRNGSYKVIFFGEKSQATVLPQMIIQFSKENIDKLKKEKEGNKNKNWKEAIRIAECVADERLKGNYDFEDEVLAGKKISKSRLKKQTSSQKPTKETVSLIRTSTNVYNQPKKDIYRQLKSLLDKFANACAMTQSPNFTKVFSNDDQSRLFQLVSASHELDLHQIISKFVLQHMILAIQEGQQWAGQLYAPLRRTIREKYNELSEQILSDVFDDLDIEKSRKDCVRQKVRKYRFGISPMKPIGQL